MSKVLRALKIDLVSSPAQSRVSAAAFAKTSRNFDPYTTRIPGALSARSVQDGTCCIAHVPDFAVNGRGPAACKQERVQALEKAVNARQKTGFMIGSVISPLTMRLDSLQDRCTALYPVVGYRTSVFLSGHADREMQ